MAWYYLSGVCLSVLWRPDPTVLPVPPDPIHLPVMDSMTFEFRLGDRIIHGSGGPIDFPCHVYDNIIRLRLAEDASQGLPRNVILKLRGNYHDLFETEQMFYESNTGLQGSFVPQYHGLTIVGGTPALVLSDLGGTMIHDDPSLARDQDSLRVKLTGLLEAVRRAGVVHDDITVLNVLHCENGRLWLVDFEGAQLNKPIDDDEIRKEVAAQVDELVGIMKERYEARMRIQKKWERRNIALS